MERYKFFVGGKSKELVEKYTSSLEYDKALAKYVAMVMLAHVKELIRRKVIEVESAKDIVNELVEIIESNGEKLYSWVKNRSEPYEDVFEALEAYLYSVVGSDAGRIAIGRSRNDHISAVLRLLMRDKAIDVLVKLLEVRTALVDKASKYKGTLFPFFTHEQVAQCGSAAIYFLSYEKSLSSLWSLILNSIDILNQNPLGSGAAAGTFIHLDVNRLSEELCFSKELVPPYYATGSRLFLLYTTSLISLVMAEISRFAEDVILLINVVQQGVEVPLHHISTSSIMPHKRNPVTLEIARAKASRVIGSLMALLASYKSLPYGYNLDFQEMNIQVIEALKDVTDTLEIVKDFINGLELREDRIRALLSDKPCWSSDLIEYLAINTGKPIRELYAELARVLHTSISERDKHLAEFLAKYGISETDVWSLYKLKPIEKSVSGMISYAEEQIRRDLEKIKRISNDLSQCSEMLIRRALEV